jgi:hypothetical protein
VLFDSERGKPRSKFVAGPTWGRAPSAVAPANATSGRSSWFSLDPENIGTSSLVMRKHLPLPAHQPVFLWFHQWRVLDFIGHFVNDAGTVQIADLSTGRPAHNAAGLPWVNGPRGRIEPRFGNPAGGQLGFGRDSHGYVASRADLSRYAGHVVQPRFIMNTDDSIAYPGWYLDDIRVYTCGSPLEPVRPPIVSGVAQVGKRLAASPGRWSRSGASYRYRWYADGHRVRNGSGAHLLLKRREAGSRITVKVTARVPGKGRTSTFSAATPPVQG